MGYVSITPDEWNKLVNAIHSTWAYIAGDAMQLEGKMTNAGAIELCLDANRIKDFDAASDAIVTRICASGGYAALHRKLCRAVKLV